MKNWGIIFYCLFITCSVSAQKKTAKVAFIADIHLLDIFADYDDFEGIPLNNFQQSAKIRSMNAQLHSTRLFNENYFVLQAVLKDIVKRNIKLVALPGDYTDDGQPLNLEGLASILNYYHNKYDIQFFITTGNHDPVQPFSTASGKRNFLKKNGQEIAIYSDSSSVPNSFKKENNFSIEPKLANAGYEKIMSILTNFGFDPQESNSYWATPFSEYRVDNYSYKKAKKAAKIENRLYKIDDHLSIPDASYVVEPTPGLWLLAIDGNAYIPEGNGKYSGTSKGYNTSFYHKKYLFSWIKKIARSAKKNHKNLIAFSHYPAIDFNDDASPILEKLLGTGKWQLERVPKEEIAKKLAESGIKIHVAGHMHINDTGKRQYGDKFIINIQTPSLAAYVPGYKILEVTDSNVTVNTISIDNVADFNTLFPAYEIELNYRKQNGLPNWDASILKSKSYRKFTEFHLQQLVELRFLPNDWPVDFLHFFQELTGEEILLLTAYKGSEIANEFLANSILRKKVIKKLPNSINWKEFRKWTGKDMIIDFYKLRNADKLALTDIDRKRVKNYKLIFNYKNTSIKTTTENRQKIALFLKIFDHFLHGLPDRNFKIDLQNGHIQNIKK
ncbi:metallophosphoesterase family protein [Zunongwangia sp.]|uniref:metallophosphoesterase family protein n=1 Tax=Zunongwangia sp. TaxID=1965325 RepID=UPI003AA911AB